MTEARKKVAFFSPFAGIWPHALPESFLAKCLDSESFDVYRIECDGTFNKHCTVMEAFGLGIENRQVKKDAICKGCIRNAGLLHKAYSGGSYLISNYLNTTDVAHANEIVEGLKENDFRALTYLGVEVGRIASYEVLIKFKKTHSAFINSEFTYYKTYVLNSLLSLMAFEKLYELIKPDILACYSPQYAIPGVCARYCELKGTQVYFIEGSSNLDERYKSLRVWDWTVFGLTNPALRYWAKADSYGITTDDYARMEKHVHRLLNAGSFSVYSEAVTGQFNMRAHFGIPLGAKVFLAAMSSYDEVYSAYEIKRFPDNKYISGVFKDQLEWIKSTIEFFSAHPELFLIVRIHPRTFPSNRNSVMAQEQIELAKILAALPDNVKANAPSEKVSIYDLYPQIDALVTGWSATGVEAMLFNVPVITYDRNLPSYPSDIHYTGDSRSDYYGNLLKAISLGEKKDVAENARRWLAFSLSVGVITHPPVLRDSNFIRKNKFVLFLYRSINWLCPSMFKKIEAWQYMHSPAEINRFNSLLKTGSQSLYDIPRAL